ncbi:hypothetical protein B4107_1105 [Bacillus safensis]|nr:hypothetical protein B4107_1105 [Bacillus safensis]
MIFRKKQTFAESAFSVVKRNMKNHGYSTVLFAVSFRCLENLYM